MGIERKNNCTVPSRGTPGFQDSTEVYNCTHMENGTNLHTRATGKGLPHVSNLALIGLEYPTKASSGCPVNVHFLVFWAMSQTFPTDANPLASFMGKPVAISYLACRPHPRHVVCIGGYSDLHILIHSRWPTPRMSKISNYHQDYHIRDIIS